MYRTYIRPHFSFISPSTHLSISISIPILPRPYQAINFKINTNYNVFMIMSYARVLTRFICIHPRRLPPPHRTNGTKSPRRGINRHTYLPWRNYNYNLPTPTTHRDIPSPWIQHETMNPTYQRHPNRDIYTDQGFGLSEIHVGGINYIQDIDMISHNSR